MFRRFVGDIPERRISLLRKCLSL